MKFSSEKLFRTGYGFNRSVRSFISRMISLLCFYFISKFYFRYFLKILSYPLFLSPINNNNNNNQLLIITLSFTLLTLPTYSASPTWLIFIVNSVISIFFFSALEKTERPPPEMLHRHHSRLQGSRGTARAAGTDGCQASGVHGERRRDDGRTQHRGRRCRVRGPRHGGSLPGSAPSVDCELELMLLLLLISVYVLCIKLLKYEITSKNEWLCFAILMPFLLSPFLFLC